jgi:hypothetical protein
VDSLINDEGVGVLMNDFDHGAYVDALTRLLGLGDIAENCRRVARSRFDLETVGGVRYRRLYQKLLNNEQL